MLTFQRARSLEAELVDSGSGDDINVVICRSPARTTPSFEKRWLTATPSSPALRMWAGDGDGAHRAMHEEDVNGGGESPPPRIYSRDSPHRARDSPRTRFRQPDSRLGQPDSPSARRQLGGAQKNIARVPPLRCAGHARPGTGMSLRFPGLFGIVLLVGIVNFVLLYFLSIWLAPSMAKGGSVICKDTARKQALALKADEVHRIKGIIRQKDNEIQRLRHAAAAATSQIHFYPIGVKGVPWGGLERAEWLSMHPVRRSYRELVLTKIDALQESGHFSVEAYGALSFDPERYPLLVIKSKIWDSSKPSVLVTGGVHGYETSGVEGALLFLQTKFSAYSSRFNFVVVPCVSPWGFEHIQRWNNNADDPNRGL